MLPREGLHRHQRVVSAYRGGYAPLPSYYLDLIGGPEYHSVALVDWRDPIDAAKADYVEGRIEIEELEERVEAWLREGEEDEDSTL